MLAALQAHGVSEELAAPEAQSKNCRCRRGPQGRQEPRVLPELQELQQPQGLQQPLEAGSRRFQKANTRSEAQPQQRAQSTPPGRRECPFSCVWSLDLEFCRAVPARPCNGVRLGFLNGGKVSRTGADNGLSAHTD